MGVWIISDNAELGGSVKSQVDALKLRSSPARVLSTTSALTEVMSVDAAPHLMVIAAMRVDEPVLQVVRQLRAGSAAKLIVAAIAADHSAVIQSVRAGADDFVKLDDQFAPELANAFQRLSAAVEKKTGGLLLTVIPSRDVGDGAFLAVNLAAAIAALHGKCGLLDFNLRGGDAALMLKLAPRHTLLDLVRRRQSVDQMMFEQAVAKHESGIELLAGPDLFADTHEIDPALCRQVVAHSQAAQAYCVVSIEDLQHAEQIGILSESDRVLIATRLDLVSLYRTQRHLDYIRKNTNAIERTVVVAAGTGYAGEVPPRAACRILQVPVVHQIPDDPSAATVSLNIGNPAVRECPQSKASRAIAKLAALLAPAVAPAKAAVRKGLLPFNAAALFGLQTPAATTK
jgi:pilus assembly protein CpaE